MQTIKTIPTLMLAASLGAGMILRRSCPLWTYQEIAGGGHMAPLTRPDLINPLVRSFLRSPLGDDRTSPMHA